MIDYGYHIQGIQRFRYWCQKVLPAVYDDSLSYYELLCKVIHKLNELIEKDNEQSEVIELILNELEDMKNEFEDFKEHGFDEFYKEQVDQWIDDHLDYIFNYIVKQVFFGLTLDGYFVAYIPESWDDIIFDTGMVYGEDTYGRLILRWDVDESGHEVNQRPEDWS
ncbi:MAG: hypothetical protein IKE94_01170 [Aeriscardovia sp.]|nr:hypothetical protein [Aeriscardovia sp.]